MRDKIRIRKCRNVPDKFREILWDNFTFNNGTMRVAMRYNTIKKVFIAFFKRELVGWSAVYTGSPIKPHDETFYSVSVYVKPSRRHHGIGGKLRRRAMLWTIKKNLDAAWFDAKQDFIWIAVRKCSAELKAR